MDYSEVAKKLYPEAMRKDGWFNSTGDYTPIISHLGEVLLQVDDDDYQGDTRVLYLNRETGEVGYLNFGWGSCSGCDALQACDSYQDIATLIKDLAESIRWDTKEGMGKFFREHDWEGDYSGQSEESRRFVESVLEYCG